MEFAIFEDCHNLIEQFVRQKNSSFQVFCTQWKQLKFQYIYAAQYSTVELLQTTAAIFYIAKRFLCGKERNETIVEDENACTLQRIGGLYLLYSIYFKQPTEQYVKIEMTMESWQNVKAFLNSLPSTLPAVNEVRYIFWKLVQSHAFRFTALDYCVGLEQLVDYDNLEEEPTGFEENSTKKLKQSLHDFEKTQELVPALTTLENGYNEMKQILAKNELKENTQALPTTSIFSEIQNAFQLIDNMLNEHADQKITKSSANKNESLESRRRALKRKGYETTQKTIEDENSEDANVIKGEKEDNNADSSNNLTHRRMSMRTVFAQKLPKDTLLDLEVETLSEEIDTDDDTEEDFEENIEDPANDRDADSLMKELFTEILKEEI